MAATKVYDDLLVMLDIARELAAQSTGRKRDLYLSEITRLEREIAKYH